MSVYFGRRWGDELGQALGNLFKTGRAIVDPGWDDRQKLEKDLQDPAKMEMIARTNYRNPGFYDPNNRNVGKDNAAAIAKIAPDRAWVNQQVTQDMLSAQLNSSNPDIASLAASLGRPVTLDEVKQNSLKTKKAEQDIAIGQQTWDMNNFKLNDAKTMADFLKQNPTAEQRRLWYQSTGATKEQGDEAERIITRRQDFFNRVRDMKSTDLQGIFDKAMKGDSEAMFDLEALKQERPAAYEGFINQMNAKQQAQMRYNEIMLRSRLDKENNETTRRAMDAAGIQQVAASFAKEYNIPFAAALALQPGYENHPELVRAVNAMSPEQRKAAETTVNNAIQSKRNVQISKALLDFDELVRSGEGINAVKQNAGARSVALAEQVRIINDLTGRTGTQDELRIEYKGRKRVMYTIGGKEVKEAELLGQPTYTTQGEVVQPPTNPTTEAPAPTLEDVRREREKRANGGNK